MKLNILSVFLSLTLFIAPFALSADSVIPPAPKEQKAIEPEMILWLKNISVFVAERDGVQWIIIVIHGREAAELQKQAGKKIVQYPKQRLIIVLDSAEQV